MTPSEALDTPSPQSERPPSRRLLPRFGLRSLFVFALLFCLFFAWVGRNAFRMRQEDAAIETLKQAGATILLQGDDMRARHPATPAPPGTAGEWGKETQEDWYGRLFGWADRLPIRHVNLQGSDPDDEKLHAALDALATFPEIESVNLLGPAFDDASLPPLAKIVGLEGIGLFDTVITADGPQALAQARELRSFALFDGSPGIVEGIASLTQLTFVTISGVAWSDPSDSVVALESIAALPHLETLSLAHLKNTDPRFLAPLAGATRLRSLSIMGVPLTADDVARIPAIETLRINGIDDAGLVRLGALPTLKKIELGPPVTVEGALKFSQSHPVCRVEYALFRPDGVIFQTGVKVEPPIETAAP